MATRTRWLVDKSALRPHLPAFADALIPKIASGRVHVCLVTELEVGYSARTLADHEQVLRAVLDPLVRLIMPVGA